MEAKRQPWERRYYCEGCGIRIILRRVHKNRGLCHGCEADDGAIDNDEENDNGNDNSNNK